MQEECAPALRQLAGRRSANIGDADLADFRQSEVTQSIVKSEVEATLARADIPEMSRAAIRSAGGKGAGSWLCPPCQPEHYFTNRQFQVSLCCRMDLDIPGHSGTCKHTKPDGSICGAILDSKGRHAKACRNQGWRVRKHNAVAAGLADCCAAHGCVVETESVVPTASDASEESRMDLILRAPNHAQPIYVDVSRGSYICGGPLKECSESRRSSCTGAGRSQEEEISKYKSHAVCNRITWQAWAERDEFDKTGRAKEGSRAGRGNRGCISEDLCTAPANASGRYHDSDG